MTSPALNMTALVEMARAMDISVPATAAEAPPRSSYLSSNGLRMHYQEWGGAAKPAILFLHGEGQTAHSWDMLCLTLAADYRCIAVDQRGHGLTDGEHAFSVEVARDDIAGVVEALRLSRFAAVSMGLGASNIIAYAARYAKTLAAAVFVDACPAVLPAAYEDPEAFRRALAAARNFDDAVAISEQHNPRGSSAYKRHTLAYSLETGPDGRWHQRSERTKRQADPDYMSRRRQQLWDAVPLIRCPALVVHGAESRVQSGENLENFRRSLPDGRLVRIDGASHDVQEDQPCALAEALRKFFTEVGY